MLFIYAAKYRLHLFILASVDDIRRGEGRRGGEGREGMHCMAWHGMALSLNHIDTVAVMNL